MNTYLYNAKHTPCLTNLKNSLPITDGEHMKVFVSLFLNTS